jgi:hypothetical protein
MAVSRNLDIMIDSFLDGITGAALFGKVRLPGAPTVLVDTRSPEVAYPRVDAAKPQHGSESVNAASVGMPTPVRGAQAANPKCGAVTEKSARPKTDLPADLGEWGEWDSGPPPTTLSDDFADFDTTPKPTAKHAAGKTRIPV